MTVTWVAVMVVLPVPEGVPWTWTWAPSATSAYWMVDCVSSVVVELVVIVSVPPPGVVMVITPALVSAVTVPIANGPRLAIDAAPAGGVGSAGPPEGRTLTVVAVRLPVPESRVPVAVTTVPALRLVTSPVAYDTLL